MGFNFHLKFFSFNRTITISRQWVQFWIIASVILISTVVSFWGDANYFYPDWRPARRWRPF